MTELKFSKKEKIVMGIAFSTLPTLIALLVFNWFFQPYQYVGDVYFYEPTLLDKILPIYGLLCVFCIGLSINILLKKYRG